MTDNTKPLGLVRDMPADDYHAINALSSSGMRILSRSAWHYKHRQPITPTKPMLRGTLVHCARLEPDAMASRYVVVPEGAPRKPTKAQLNAKKSSEDSRAAMAWWADFARMAEGRQIVSAEDYATTQMQLAAIAENPDLADLFSEGYGECSVFWNDPETGVYCKARPDWVRPINARQVRLIDLKSTADESPSGFGRSAANLKYHIQAAHYAEGFERATGLEVVEFIFAAVTSSKPVLAVPYILHEELQAQAAEEWRELVNLYAYCLKEDRWPAYGEGPQLLDFPAWAKRNAEVEVAYV